jgi:Kef-type K+ transport system membrane component KefB
VNTLLAIKVIAGLMILVVLAYLGGHRRVVRFQEQLGITGVITAGFPLIALGVIAALPGVDVLTGDVVDSVRPILQFGLGWLGFISGASLDIRVLENMPKGSAYTVLVEALGPFAFTTVGCGALMVAFGSEPDDPTVWRDCLMLGAAAAMSAPRRSRTLTGIRQLDGLIGMIGLLFITSYFRDAGSAWDVPETGWIFVSLGIGVAVGVLIFTMVRTPSSNAELLAVVIGGIAFASGLAGYLRLSPIVVCFIAGVLVTNFPNDVRDSVFRILRHLERPVHLLFLIVAGALWSVTDWRGWVLVPVFVVARITGTWLGIKASRSETSEDRVLVAPVSALSIALVISLVDMYRGERLAWVVTAVIGGALLTELLVQAALESGDTIDDDDPAPRKPIDELDDFSGPIYKDDYP